MIASMDCHKTFTHGPAFGCYDQDTKCELGLRMAWGEEDTSEVRSSTPLHWAAGDGDCRVVRDLLSIGARVEARDGEGRTPLLRAAAEARIDVVRLLLAHGASPSALDDAGSSALHLAARRGDGPTVRMLLEGGSDPRLLDSSGRTAMDLARLENNRVVLEEFRAWTNRSVRQGKG